MNKAATVSPLEERKEGLTSRLSRWLSSKRQRADSFLLTQKNIYIFPSKPGFSFGLMLLIMLLTAVNYQSSLVYLLTFFLGAVFKVSIWLCFFNLRGLQVNALSGNETFAGDPLRFKVQLSRERRRSVGLTLFERDGTISTSLDVEPESPSIAYIERGKASRGLHVLDELSIRSYFPFGLIRAWTWLGLDAKVLVFPEPLDPKVDGLTGREEEASQGAQKSTQLDLLRNYQPGDVISRVHWKKYASAEQLVVREGESVNSDGEWLRWDDYAETGVETALSFLCHQVLVYSKRGVCYGLELPTTVLEPASGEAHRLACLKALALYGEPKGNHSGGSND